MICLGVFLMYSLKFWVFREGKTHILTQTIDFSEIEHYTKKDSLLRPQSSQVFIYISEHVNCYIFTCTGSTSALFWSVGMWNRSSISDTAASSFWWNSRVISFLAVVDCETLFNGISKAKLLSMTKLRPLPEINNK